MKKTMLAATGLLALAKSLTSQTAERLPFVRPEPREYRANAPGGARTTGRRKAGEAQREADAHNRSLPPRPGQGRVSDYMRKARQEVKANMRASQWNTSNRKDGQPPRSDDSYRAVRREVAKRMRRA
jgi:hypothetical protein